MQHKDPVIYQLQLDQIFFKDIFPSAFSTSS